MKLARYWTRASAEAGTAGGEPIRTTARGWSNDSMEAARELARALAGRVAARLASGQAAQLQYEYGARPLPEPVIQKFDAPSGDSSAVVTRNAYGALVLNTVGLMFVDVDGKTKPADSGRGGGIFASLFGRAAATPPAADPRLAGFQSVAERHGLSVRVYETAAGYRLATTNVGFQAGSAEAERLLGEFGADPLYIRLCRNQESFRARLTPKPWRCGHYKNPVAFPYDPNEEGRFEHWESTYNAKCSPYATCRFVTALGAAIVTPEFGELIAHHDQVTKSATSLPLA